MGGYGAACPGHQDFPEGQGIFYRFCHPFHKLGVAAGMGHKHPIQADRIPVCQPVCHIGQQGFFEFAPVFLAHPHCTLLHSNAGLQLEQVRTNAQKAAEISFQYDNAELESLLKQICDTTDTLLKE